MATATASTETHEQISELAQRASELKQNFESEYGDIMQQISALATGEQAASPTKPKPKAAATTPTSSSASASSAPKPPKRGSRNKPSTPSGKAASTTKSSGPVKPENRNYDNDMSLKEAVFDVLDRENWEGILTKEDGDVTLSAGEIKKVIETEGKWVSSSADITSQLQGALRDLRKQNLVVWENKRYYVPEGAEYPKS